MTTLKDISNRDVADLVSVDDFGELITYYPGGVLGDAITIPALVDREEPGVRFEDGSVSRWGCTLTIRRHATTGITTWTKLDRALVPLRFGEAAVTVRVARLDYADEGLFRLECHR